MKIVVATQNPVKVNAVKQAFGEVFDLMSLKVEGVAMAHDIPEQPFGDAIINGATQRAEAVLTATDADVGVGIEAGLMQPPGSAQWLSVQFCALVDRHGGQAIGMGPGFELPKPILEAVLAGESLRDAFERVLGVDDPERLGAIHYLSNGLIDRTQLTIQAVRMALVHWMNHDGP